MLISVLKISRMELIKAWACLGNTGLFFQGLLATLLDSDNKIVVSLPDRMELRSEAATVLIEVCIDRLCGGISVADETDKTSS